MKQIRMSEPDRSGQHAQRRGQWTTGGRLSHRVAIQILQDAFELRGAGERRQGTVLDPFASRKAEILTAALPQLAFDILPGLIDDEARHRVFEHAESHGVDG
ncbi:MAG: hypothetical protein WDN30_11160 [Pararobbsia sp.]